MRLMPNIAAQLAALPAPAMRRVLAWRIAAAVGDCWRAAMRPQIAAAAARFGKLALRVVALLFAAGVSVLSMLIGSVAQLWSSDYGRLMSIKLLAVAALLGLAAWNKLYLTPGLLHRQARAPVLFRRSLAAEIGVGAFILTITAAFTTLTGPPLACNFTGQRVVDVYASRRTRHAGLYVKRRTYQCGRQSRRRRAVALHAPIGQRKDAAGIAAREGQVMDRGDHQLARFRQPCSRRAVSSACRGSRPAMGSSMIRTSGSATSARASMARASSPPESVVAG